LLLAQPEYLSGQQPVYPNTGLNFVQALEQTTATAVLFFGNDFMMLELDFPS